MKDKYKVILWVVILILAIAGLVMEMVTPNSIMIKHYMVYLELFFLFMLSFCKLASIYLKKSNEFASKKLNDISVALIFLFLVTSFALDFIK